MNRRQKNLLTMGQAVLGHFDQQPTLWNNLSPITAVVTSLRSIIKEITTLSQKQEENSTPGFTRSKDNELEKLQDGTQKLSAQLRAFGKVKGDEVLLESVRYKRSAFELMPAQSLLQVSQIVINHARTNLPDLGDYGVTEAGIANLEGIHSQIMRLINLRDTAGGTKKAATDSIPEMLTQMRDKLDLLDDLIESLVEDDEFVNVYYNMRKIIDRGGRTATPEEAN